MTNKLNWKYPEKIVECDWLYKQIKNNNLNLRIYDCTTYLHYTDSHPRKPYNVESGFNEYKKNHIPSSAYLDIKKNLSMKSSLYEFTLPKLDNLAKNFQKLGIGEPYQIILYSRNGMQWSTRVWWMLKILGYNNVSILNGGLNEWVKLNLPTEIKINRYNKSFFKVKFKYKEIADKKEVLNAIQNNSIILINALTKEIHLGESTRYGRPGRIPGSINIPFHDVLNKKSGKFKKPIQIKKIFDEIGVSNNIEIINYCGGGIAATLILFTLFQLGFNKLKIYDNSMSEWGIDKNLPIEI